MSALTVSQDPDQNWDDLVRFWEEMEWPEGSKVEIIEGIVTVSPPPANQHNLIAEAVQRRLYAVIPDDWGIFQTLAIASRHDWVCSSRISWGRPRTKWTVRATTSQQLRLNSS